MLEKSLPGEIAFYYAHPDLFEDVQHQSAFMCKNIVSKEGEDLSERFAITDDEIGMFEICLKETLPDIYDAVKALTYNIEYAVYPDITGEDIESTIGQFDVDNEKTYVFIRLNDNGAYNPNTPRAVDLALRSTIVQGVLANFYTRVTHPELTKLSASMYAAQMNALTQRIIPLRKKTKF